MFERGAGAHEGVRTTTVDDSFACSVLTALGALAGEAACEDSLALPLSLSLSLRRSNISLTDAVAALLHIRTALLRCADLDEAGEPTPLLYADERTSVLSLARYLIDLLRRAADAHNSSPCNIAELAIESLQHTRGSSYQQRRLVAVNGLGAS